jgi:NTP pyrophosphatase (non-canonical NTP hydrolase)
MKDWEYLINELVKFREERNWKQFHNAKDLSLALSIEASELNELYLWKNPEDADAWKVRDELADVFAYGLLLAHEYGFDVQEIILEKMKKNGEKYPVDKAKGNATKYDQL